MRTGDTYHAGDDRCVSALFGELLNETSVDLQGVQREVRDLPLLVTRAWRTGEIRSPRGGFGFSPVADPSGVVCGVSLSDAFVLIQSFSYKAMRWTVALQERDEVMWSIDMVDIRLIGVYPPMRRS